VEDSEFRQGADDLVVMPFRSLAKSKTDETYLDGKDRNRHWNKKSAQQRKAKGRQKLGAAIGYGKVGVIGAIERKGNVVCKVIGSMDAPTLSHFVPETVSEKVSLVATDENPAY
jgi:hypothetical protein